MREFGNPVIRGILAVVSLILALFCLYIAYRFASGFFWPDSGDFPGNAGQLLFALFFVVFAGPFVSLTFVLGAPLISDDPRWRGADQ